MRILVVDDDDDVRSLMVLALDGMDGHEVVGQASNVEDAVRGAAGLRPDVVITDLVHSTGDKPPLLCQLRDAAPDARLIVFSGMPRRAGEPLPADADDYVVKGGRLDPLLDAVRRAAE